METAKTVRRYQPRTQDGEIIPLAEAIERLGLDQRELVPVKDHLLKEDVCFFDAEAATVDKPGWWWCGSACVEYRFSFVTYQGKTPLVSSRGVVLARREDGLLEAMCPA